MGGYLGDQVTVKQIGEIIKIFQKFHFLLPCLFCAAFCFVGWIIAYIFIEETLTPQVKQQQAERAYYLNLFFYNEIVKLVIVIQYGVF